jgi:hypothetical protein
MGREMIATVIATEHRLPRRLLLLIAVVALAVAAFAAAAPGAKAADTVCPRVDGTDPCGGGGGGGLEAKLNVTVATSPLGTSAQPAWDDQDLTYTVTLSNDDSVDEVTGATLLSEPVAGQASYVSATASQGSCMGTSTVSCSLGTIGPGGTATVTIAVRPSAGTLSRRFTTGSNELLPDSVLKSTNVRAGNLSAAFDWSMPDRARDDNEDGLLDMTAPPGGYAPSGWQVNFNACASTGHVESYRWEIDGLSQNVAGFHSEEVRSQCDATLPPFAKEGKYRVKLTVNATGGGTQSVTHDIQVQDRLIVVMGDSYASGEGNPHSPVEYGFLWVRTAASGWATDWVEDKRCHRSAYAASALSALTAERSDPKTSVTYISRACTGAMIDSGILGGYAGGDPDYTASGPLSPQIDQVQNVVEGRTIDDMLISIGGNDIGFAKIITDCVLTPNCHTNAGVVNEYNNKLGDMQESYERFMEELARRRQTGALNVRTTYITEYPDPTTDASGQRCAVIPHDWTGGIGAPELNWASGYVLHNLNLKLSQAVEKANEDHGLNWRFVAGVMGDFIGHGYCAGDARWLRTFVDSCDLQGPKYAHLLGGCSFGVVPGTNQTLGMMHPNAAGHGAIAARYIPLLHANAPVFESMPPPDGDGDGVPDSQDACPGQPAATQNGCPPPPDGDGDGVPDSQDACPGQPAATQNGCPSTNTNTTNTTNTNSNTNTTNTNTTNTNTTTQPASGKPGKCSKLKGKKRARCVKKACARFNRGRRTAAKRKQYAKCVRAVTRKR